jgi:hypothetical protein
MTDTPKEKDFDIEITDSEITPVEEPVVIEDEKRAADDGVEVESALSKLKQELEEERYARKQAEDAARAAYEQARMAYTEADDTNITLVGNAIDTIKRDNDILTQNYAEAMSSGEYDRGAQIQAALAANAVKLDKLENGLQEMQKSPKRVPPPPQVASSKMDQIISSVTPRSAAWLKSNRDTIDNDRMINRMFRAHEDAVDEGIEPDSDSYFRFIEGRLGLNKQTEQESPLSSASKPVARQAAPPAAPVNRNSTGRNNMATLTRAEAEMAKTLGMTDKEYWLHKNALQKEGKLPN